MEKEGSFKMVIPPKIGEPSKRQPSFKWLSVSKKRWRLFVWGILILLVLGGIAYALKPLIFEMKPEEVFEEMEKKMMEVKSLSYESTINIETESLFSSSSDSGFSKVLRIATAADYLGQIPDWGKIPPPSELEEQPVSPETPKIPEIHEKLGFLGELRLSLSAQGKINLIDLNNPQLATVLEGTFSREGIDVSFGGELRIIRNAFYFKLTKVPTIPFIGDISKIKDQWYGYVMEDEKLAREVEEMLKKIEERKVPKELTPEEQQKIKELILKLKPYKIERQKDEVINEKKVFHYRVFIKKEELLKLIEELAKIRGEEYPKEAKEKLSAILGQLENYPFEFWIGKKDFYLYKLAFEGEFKDEKISSGKIKFKTSTVFSDFNQDIKVEPPSEFKSLETLFEEVFGKEGVALDLPQEKERDARRLADIMVIKGALELYHNHHGKYPEKLELLVPTYLPKIPQDPTPEKSIYAYFLEKESYRLFFVKETKEEAGIYVVTPEEPMGKLASPELLSQDFDEDGLTNKQEITVYQTDIANLDTDGDGYKDGDEVKAGYNPKGPGKLEKEEIKEKKDEKIKDSDWDGMPDEWEEKYGLKPEDPKDMLEDPDKDELANFQEYDYNTDPHNSDTDKDGYLDGVEVEHGYNPLGPGKLKESF